MATKTNKPLSRRKQARLSRVIDRELDQKARIQENIIKILIFGTDGSGRSTFFRTISHLHQTDRSLTTQHLIASIHSICLHAIKTLSELTDLSDPEILAAKKIIDTVSLDTLLDEKIGECIDKVWRDYNVQAVYTSSKWNRKGRSALERMKKTNQALRIEIEESKLDFRPEIMKILLSYTLEHGAFVNSGYFLDHIREITKPGFVPEFDSIIRTPPPVATGIAELSFSSDVGHFTIFDVSGQRNKTSKWIQCFGGISCLFFITSLSFYDEYLESDPTVNRLLESLEVFEDLVNGNWASKSGIVVFLNRLDIFREKLKENPFTLCFPNYTGESADDAVAYLKDRFQERDHVGTRRVYVYSINPLNKDSIDKVWKDIESLMGRPLNHNPELFML